MRRKVNLKSRIERLERRPEEQQESVIQFSLLHKLPDDFVGERHVAVVKRGSSSIPGWEGCEFEERPGPDPGGPDDRICRIFLSELDLRL